MTVVPINQKYTLTIKEASAYFSIGIKKLRRMAEAKDEAGNLPAYSVFLATDISSSGTCSRNT